MNISVNEAAQIIGTSNQFVREMCKLGKLGDTFKGHGKRKVSIVSQGLLMKWMGYSRQELENEIQKIRREK